MSILLMLNMLLSVDAYANVYEQGLAHLDAQHHEAAAQSFEQLVAEGVVSAPLFYNLGLAYHQSGHRGLALANYDRALALDPGLAAAQDNRFILMSELQRIQTPPLPPGWQQALLFWHGGLGYSSVLWVAGLAWCGFWILLALRLWRPVPYAGLAAPLLLVCAALFGLSAWVKAHPMPLAIVVQPEAQVFYGTEDTGTVRFELYEGDRVKVDGRREGWIRIESAQGEKGWVRKEHLVELGPPYEAWQNPGKAAAMAPPLDGIGASGVTLL